MRLLAVIVLVLAACGETRQHVHRWPAHRREKDAKIEALIQKAAQLETRLGELEAVVRRLQPAAAPLAPAAPAGP